MTRKTRLLPAVAPSPMRIKAVLVLAASSAVLLIAAATAQGASSAAACTDGQTTFKGADARNFCGPASAVVKLGGRTVRYRLGVCRHTRDAIELNIGLAILDVKDPAGPLPRYFGIAVGKVFGVGKAAPRDGVYRGATLVLVDRGKRFAAMKAEVELSGGRKRGSFKGTLMGGPSFSGTFSC